MEKTSRSNRLHIGFYGKTNAGKSTLVNKITGQDVSVVSEKKGTTTDVVYKPMELLPIGPVVFMDTAGINDTSALGEKRIKKTMQTLDKADIAVIICDNDGWDRFEINLSNLANLNKTPIIAIVTKNDINNISEEKIYEIKKYTNNIIYTNINDDSLNQKFIDELLKVLPEEFTENKTVTGNLVKEKDTVILVVPIDKEAPKGRLILPQVQMIRELLDKNAKTIVVKETELKEIINELKNPPKLVITDSQAFKKVAEIVPKEIELTSFSILLANFKGDIKTFSEGAKALEKLHEGDKILFLESCTHHAVEDDIARVKIPKLIEKTIGKTFEYSYHTGCSMPENIKEFSLLIHCGACMTNKKEVLSRIAAAQKFNIPITNYGIMIAHCLGILDRAIRPLKNV